VLILLFLLNTSDQITLLYVHKSCSRKKEKKTS